MTKIAKTFKLVTFNNNPSYDTRYYCDSSYA